MAAKAPYLADLEKRLAKVPATVNKPNPSVGKPSSNGGVRPGTASTAVTPSVGLKPSVASKLPASISEAPRNQTNDVTKWPPVNVTPSNKPQPLKTKTTAVVDSAPKSPGPKTNNQMVPEQSSPSVRSPVGRGRGFKLPTPASKPTVGIKAGQLNSAKEKQLPVGGTNPRSSPTNTSPTTTPAPPWAALVKKKGSANDNTRIVDDSNSSNKDNSRPKPVPRTVKQVTQVVSNEEGSFDSDSKENLSQRKPAIESLSSEKGDQSQVENEDGRSTGGEVAKIDCDVSPHACPPSTPASCPPPTNENCSDDIVSVGTKSYRLQTTPSLSGVAPPRKPAKPPYINLSSYHQMQNTDDDNDEIYDDVGDNDSLIYEVLD